MHKAQANAVAIRTQKAIAEAFLSLIQERAYEKISVTDICRRATSCAKPPIIISTQKMMWCTI